MVKLTKKKIGYSLWLLPEKKISAQFQKIINLYSKKYNFPKFKPHITINNYEYKKNLKDLGIVKHHKIKIFVDNIKIKNFFYYSIFLNIKLKKELYNFHKITKINMRKNKFKPHLSLIYSNNKKLKEIIFKELKKKNKFKNLSFYCDKAAYVKFNEIKNKWKIIKLYKLIRV